MAAPSYVFTIARVARMLGEDEALLEDIASDMDPEDGCLSVLGLDDDVSTTSPLHRSLASKTSKSFSPTSSRTQPRSSSDPTAPDHHRGARRMVTAVLEPGAIIAGAGAAAIRSGALGETAVDWLKTNFLKTELELGHCLRLPAEGPCECELYLSCSRFVTTPVYAPRLRERHKVELDLAEDAASRGWPREVERHRCTATRIEQLLADMRLLSNGDGGQ